MVVARATRCLLSQLHVNLLELSAFPVFGEDGEDAQRLPAPDVTDLGKKYIAEIHICAGELDKEEGAATSSAQAAALRAERQRTEWAACITELALLVFVQRPAVLGELLARRLSGHAIPREFAHDARLRARGLPLGLKGEGVVPKRRLVACLGTLLAPIHRGRSHRLWPRRRAGGTATCVTRGARTRSCPA